MATLVLLCLLAVLTGPTEATPAVSFPINAQVPPIARVARPFSFVFSASTFSSTSPITYSLRNPPAWLSVDSPSRRLYGTPHGGDVLPGKVAGVPIELVATDATGSTTLSATLVVARSPPPTVVKPLSDQIEGFGAYSEPSSILSYPDKDFSFAFATDTFSSPELNYYAVTGEDAPLPAWISFDPGRLAFAGRTPPLSSLIEHPQAFNFKLVASDVTGFSAASISFSIVVGNNEISVTDPVITLNATVGKHLSYIGLTGMVKVDKRPVKPDALIASAVDMPGWLSFDKATWELSGTPPSDAKGTRFTIAFEDASSDRTNVTIRLLVASGIFRDTPADLTVERGARVSFDLRPFLWRPSDIDVSFQTKPSAPWLQFDTDTLTWSGDLPGDVLDSSVSLLVDARSKTTDAREVRSWAIRVLGADPTFSARETAAPPAASTTPPGESDAVPSDQRRGGPTNYGLLAILLPILIVCVGFVAIVCCFYRRRRNRLSRRLDRKEISGPVPGSFVFNGGGGGEGSLHSVSKQFDIGDTNALVAVGEPRKGGRAAAVAAGLRRSRTDRAVPPVPAVPPVAASGKIRSLSDHGVPDAGGSWFSGGVALFPGHRARKSKSKRYLSDTSLYEDDPSTLNLLNYGKEGAAPSKARRKLSPLETANSIQHTPDLAYGGRSTTEKESRPVRACQRESRPPRQPEPAALPPRPKSRLDNYDRIVQDRRLSRQRPTAPPARDTHNPQRVGEPSRSSTVDTFSHRRSRHSQGLRGGSMVRRPRTPCPAQTETRPVSRRDGDEATFFAGSGNKRTQFGPRQRARALPPVPDTPSMSQTRESWARKKAAAASRQSREPVGSGKDAAVARREASSRNDSLGISYEDLVTEAPFHPSKTWTTLESDEPNWTAHTGSAASDGSDWRDVDSSGTESSRGLGGPARTEAGTVSPASPEAVVGQAVSRYSKQSVKHVEHQGKAGSEGSGKSGRSQGSDEDFVVFV